MTKPKILLLDLESSPTTAYVWGRWEQNIAQCQVVQESNLLTWSAKWLGDKKVMQDSLHNYKGWKPTDDKNIVHSLWKLVDEADIIVAHNGDSFDIPLMNARFAVHGLKPPSPYQTVDTKRVAKSNFRFPSNKLDDLLKHLNLGSKMDTGGFQLWRDCMDGKVSAFKKMLRYNVVDVKMLENLYLELRPWMKRHPNVSLLLNEGNGCPACGHKQFIKNGVRHNARESYARLQCTNCGKWSKGNISPRPVKATVRN